LKKADKDKAITIKEFAKDTGSYFFLTLTTFISLLVATAGADPIKEEN